MWSISKQWCREYMTSWGQEEISPENFEWGGRQAGAYEDTRSRQPPLQNHDLGNTRRTAHFNFAEFRVSENTSLHWQEIPASVSPLENSAAV